MITRRGFIGFLAAPAIVRVASLMPISVIETPSLETFISIIIRSAFEPHEIIDMGRVTAQLGSFEGVRLHL